MSVKDYLTFEETKIKFGEELLWFTETLSSLVIYTAKPVTYNFSVKGIEFDFKANEVVFDFKSEKLIFNY